MARQATREKTLPPKPRAVMQIKTRKAIFASNSGSDAILMTDQLAESVFVESIQQHSVSIGERLLPSQRRMPYH
jgi:hypothetical protein